MNDTVKTFFDNKTDKFCQIYKNPNLIDRIFRKSVLARFEKTFLECRANNYQSVLDIGCGSALLAIKLVQAGMDVVGVDFSEEMVKTANSIYVDKDTSGKLEIKHADFANFDAGRRFDAVIALGFFDYIANPEVSLKKMFGLAKKEVIVSFPAAEDILSIQRKIRYLIFKKCPVYFYKKKQIERLVADCGFSDFKLTRVYRDYLLLGYLK